MPSNILISAYVAVTPSNILISDVDAVTPDNLFNSFFVAVTPANILISAPVAVIEVAPKVKEEVVNSVNEPTDVIFGCAAVDIVPFKLVAVIFVLVMLFILVISLLESITNALLAAAVPGETPVNSAGAGAPLLEIPIPFTVKVAQSILLILEISRLESTTNALLASAVPGLVST